MSDDAEIADIENPTAYPPSIQAGIPKLGATPKGWTRFPLGDLILRVERPAKLVDAETYQLVTAKRNRGGIVARETLRGNQIRTKTQFYVATGDFLISNRQISHGACGIVPADLHRAVVSNEYTAFHTSDALDPRFLNALSHSVYFQETCFHSSVGVHVEKLVFRLEDWLDWEFDIPPLPEQRRIVAVLHAWDEAIDQTERLIDAKRRQFEGLLRATIGVNQQAESRSNLWSRVELGKLVDFKSGGTPNRSTAAYWNGNIPWITAKDMKAFELFSSLDMLTEAGAAKVNLAPAGAILMLVRGMGLFKDLPLGIATRPLAFNQDVKSLIPKPHIDPRFLAYALRSRRRAIMDHVDHAGHGTGRLPTDFLEAMPIAFPGHEEQSQTSALLDAAEARVGFCMAFLVHLHTQKRGLMQKLLAGECRLDERFDPPALSARGTLVGSIA